MADRPVTADGATVGGWVLRGDRRSFDVGPMLEEFGQVFRYPVDPGPRVDLMGPGQPCFLFLTDTNRVVGVWAIGEVVAEPLSLPVDPSDPEGARQLFAEVEMLPLAKPIAGDKLRGIAALGDSELFTAPPDAANPLVLSPAAVRAIEGLEFELVPPTDQQAARLEAVLDAEDGA